MRTRNVTFGFRRCRRVHRRGQFGPVLVSPRGMLLWRLLGHETHYSLYILLTLVFRIDSVEIQLNP